jgi:hypothetical protein
VLLAGVALGDRSCANVLPRPDAGLDHIADIRLVDHLNVDEGCGDLGEAIVELASDGSGSRAVAGLTYAAAHPSPAMAVIVLIIDFISFPLQVVFDGVALRIQNSAEGPLERL